MTGFFNRKIIFLITLFLLSLLTFHPVFAQSIGETGLSFVAFSKNTYYGMNLDTSAAELRFRINEENKQRVLFIDTYTNDIYMTIAGINDQGVFVTYQNFFTTSNPVYLTPTDFVSQFGDLLYERSRVPDPKTLSLENSKIVIDHANQLFASELGKSFIIESSTGYPAIIEKQLDWQILSPLASSFSDNENIDDFYHPYKQKLRAEAEIRKYISDFSLLDGFRVLKAAQPRESQTASIIIDPGKNQIYIVLDKDFAKIWMINLDGATIETYSGIDKYHKGNMPEIGLTSNDLRILNFSNESLMDGVILWGVVIIVIILLVTAANYFRSKA